MALGFVLVDKPQGLTSFQALGAVKRSVGTRRVGHTGTLDKFATGLLVCLVGRLTRLADDVSSGEKEYEARFRFGVGTDTLDPTGAVTATGHLPDEDAIRSALDGFLGDVQQVPPLYSAVHVAGMRASDRVRRGEVPVLRPRTVRIEEIVLDDYSEGDARVRIRCSKGTYVRSLARDLAESLGTVAHVAALRRTRVGPFRVADAQDPESGSVRLRSSRELVDVLWPDARRIVDEAQIQAVRQGKAPHVVLPDLPARDRLALFDAGERLIAVLRGTGSDGEYRYDFVVPAEESLP